MGTDESLEGRIGWEFFNRGRLREGNEVFTGKWKWVHFLEFGGKKIIRGD